MKLELIGIHVVLILLSVASVLHYSRAHVNPDETRALRDRLDQLVVELADVRARAAGADEIARWSWTYLGADVEVAHIRVGLLEHAIRIVAATGPCRARLPRPMVEDPMRPLTCEDRLGWWAEPIERAKPCYAGAEIQYD